MIFKSPQINLTFFLRKEKDCNSMALQWRKPSRGLVLCRALPERGSHGLLRQKQGPGFTVCPPLFSYICAVGLVVDFASFFIVIVATKSMQNSFTSIMKISASPMLFFIFYSIFYKNKE